MVTKAIQNPVVLNKGDRIRATQRSYPFAELIGTVDTAINYGTEQKPDWYIQMTTDDGPSYFKQVEEKIKVELLLDEPEQMYLHFRVEVNGDNVQPDMVDKVIATFKHLYCHSKLEFEQPIGMVALKPVSYDYGKDGDAI